MFNSKMDNKSYLGPKYAHYHFSSTVCQWAVNHSSQMNTSCEYKMYTASNYGKLQKVTITAFCGRLFLILSHFTATACERSYKWNISSRLRMNMNFIVD